MNKKQLIFMWLGIGAILFYAFVKIVDAYYPDYADFSVGVFLVVLVTSGLIYTFRDKKGQEGEKIRRINLRRGFRRITFVLAIVAAFIGLVIAVGTVIDKYNSEQDDLRLETRIRARIRALDFSEVGEQEQKGRFYDLAHPNTPKSTLEKMASTPKSAQKESSWENTLEKEKRSNWEDTLAGVEKEVATQEPRELRDGFWVTLSKHGLVGLCILVGLGGAAAGFGGVWLVYFLILCVYQFIKWLVMGFYGINQSR